jgi:hypothetical protein
MRTLLIVFQGDAAARGAAAEPGPRVRLRPRRRRCPRMCWRRMATCSRRLRTSPKDFFDAALDHINGRPYATLI